MYEDDKIIEETTTTDYKYGFTTDHDQEFSVKGLSEEVIRFKI
jgi:Fe-S cluster assembly protein SufB